MEAARRTTRGHTQFICNIEAYIIHPYNINPFNSNSVKCYNPPPFDHHFLIHLIYSFFFKWRGHRTWRKVMGSLTWHNVITYSISLLSLSLNVPSALRMAEKDTSVSHLSLCLSFCRSVSLSQPKCRRPQVSFSFPFKKPPSIYGPPTSLNFFCRYYFFFKC